MSDISVNGFQNWVNNGAQSLYAGFIDATAKLSSEPEKIAAATQQFQRFRAMFEGMNSVNASYTESEFRKAGEWKNIRA